MLKRRRMAIGAAALVFLVVLLGGVLRLTIFAPSSAQASGTVLTVIAGDVLIQHPGAGAPAAAVDGEALAQGDRIITRATGRAVVTFFEGSTQTIEPNSDITLTRLATVAGGGLLADITQAVGTTWTTVFKTSSTGSDVTVETPAATAAVRDTMFYTYVAPGGETSVWTRQGIVAVSAHGVVQNVTAGTQSLVAPGHEPAPPVEAQPPASELTLTLDGPGWMLVRSPDGYSSGLVPPGAPVNQIPLATITDPSARPEVVSLISLGDGVYDVYLAAREGVLFQLTAYDGLGWATHCYQTRSGAMRPGEIWRVQVSLRVAGGKLDSCSLSDPVLTHDDPFSKVRVPNALALALAAGQRVIPELSVLGRSTSPTPAPSPAPGVVLPGGAAPTEAPPAGETAAPEPTEPGPTETAVATGTSAPDTATPAPQIGLVPGGAVAPTSTATPVPPTPSPISTPPVVPPTPTPTPTRTPLPTATPTPRTVTGLAPVVAPPYDQSYTAVDLGPVPGLPAYYGPVTFKAGDPSTLLVGGSSQTGSGALFAVPVTRDSSGHVSAVGSAAYFAAAPYNDGGLAYGPGGVLFVAQWPVDAVAEIAGGSSVVNKTVPLGTSVNPSVSTLTVVPAGLPGAGQLKLAGWPYGPWYSASLAPDGSGTYDISGITFVESLPNGPRGLVYVPAGHPQIPAGSLVVAEYSSGQASVYQVDAAGNPVVSSRALFVDGLAGAEGAAVDPVTGDFLFVAYAFDRIIEVRLR